MALYLLFFLSGATSLVYEVAWLRGLSLVFGSTTFATSAVLTAFMGGLALGAFLAGRWTATPRPAAQLLRAYGALEAGIGAYALLVPWLFAGAVPLYQGIWAHWQPGFLVFSLVRLALSVALLLLPATAMGASLPLLAAYLATRPRGEALVPWLYGINTLGAVAGALGAGFWLLPGLGETWAIAVTAAANLAIAAGALALAAQPGRGRGGRGAAPAGPTPAGEARLMWLLGLSGFLALIYEVAWTRTLALLVGSSVYAFATMLGIFLAGLALGGLALAGPAAKARDRWAVLALLELGVGVTALAGVALAPELPYLALRLLKAYPGSHGALVLLQFGGSLLLMGAPTFLLGGVFATAMAEVAASERPGEAVGRLYAANTLGGIAGAATGGFLLLPAAGLAGSLTGAALASVALAGYALAWSATPRKGRAQAAFALLIAVCLVAPPRWSPEVMGSAMFYYAGRYSGELSRRAFLGQQQQRHVLFYREGYTTSVLVTQMQHNVALKVNGKTDASTTADLPTQFLLGHMPMMLHGSARDVLVIGLGSGGTVAAVARWPVRRVDVAEIEPGIVSAARLFGVINDGVLDDPRVHVVAEDGRNLMLVDPRRYDVIVSEPSNPWMAGVAKLYTAEAFALGRSRLNPGGVYCQWIHTYNLRPERLRQVVAAFRLAFPHALLIDNGDLFLMGSERPLALTPGLVQAALARPNVVAQLRQVRADSPDALLYRVRLGDDGLARFAGDAVPNTDDNGLLEYGAPLDLEVDTGWAVFAALGEHARIPPEATAGWSWDPARYEAMATAALKAQQFEMANRYAVAAGPRPGALRVLAEMALRENQLDQARAWLEKVRAPRDPETLVALSRLAGKRGDFAGSKRLATAALAARPGWPDALWMRGAAAFASNGAAAAVPDLQRAAAVPGAVLANADILRVLALAYQSLGRKDEALTEMRRYKRMLHTAAVTKYRMIPPPVR